MRLLACVAAPVAADDFTPEPGFAALLNGKDLAGWRVRGKPGESLDGKTEAHQGRFKVTKDGTLVIDPAVKGDVRIETAREFGPETVIRFDFRPGPGCNNDLFLLGSKFDINPAMLKTVKVGEWNAMEVAASGGRVVFRINGEVARTDQKKADTSAFEIRAEYRSLEVRRMRVKTGG